MKRTIWIWTMALVALGAATAEAQRGRGGGGFGFPGGGGGSTAFLLMNSQVQDELQMVDDQRQKVRDVLEGMQDRFRDAFSGLDGLSQEERRDAVRERIADLQKGIDEEFNQILLPHQRDRLQQIVLQQQIRRSGAAGALASETVSAALGLTEAQKEQLEKAREEAEAQLEEDIRKARDAAVEKVLSVLTPEQRAQWNKMQGGAFELERQPFGGGNRRNRGRDRGDDPGGEQRQPDA